MLPKLPEPDVVVAYVLICLSLSVPLAVLLWLVGPVLLPAYLLIVGAAVAYRVLKV